MSKLVKTVCLKLHQQFCSGPTVQRNTHHSTTLYNRVIHVLNNFLLSFFNHLKLINKWRKNEVYCLNPSLRRECVGPTPLGTSEI